MIAAPWKCAERSPFAEQVNQNPRDLLNKNPVGLEPALTRGDLQRVSDNQSQKLWKPMSKVCPVVQGPRGSGVRKRADWDSTNRYNE